MKRILPKGTPLFDVTTCSAERTNGTPLFRGGVSEPIRGCTPDASTQRRHGGVSEPVRG